MSCVINLGYRGITTSDNRQNILNRLILNKEAKQPFFLLAASRQRQIFFDPCVYEMFAKVPLLFISLGAIQYFSQSNDQVSHCSIALFVH